MSPQHLLTVIDIYSKWTPSTKSGAVSKGFLLPKGPLLKEQLGSTELEDHHIRSCRPSPKWAGDQLKRASVVSFEPVCSKSLLCSLRTTPRMYSMEQHHHHRHHHCHHNLHLGRRNVWYFQPRVSCCLPWYNWCNWCMLCKGHKSSDKHITNITSWL